MTSNKIYITKPYLPPLEEVIPYLEKIWERRILTNGGPFHQELEAALCKHLGVEHISLFNNGTIALITALQALDISGEVITTPYSFVATSNALLWNGMTPVFADIDPVSLNIDPTRIEVAITEKTTAILAVHCYGNACDVDAIEKIADKYKLKVIYDAAHAFGVRRGTKSLLCSGDLSIVSFHATKVFNTFEGGAIVCRNAEMKAHIDNLKNFGFIDETTVIESGINGKMSEFNAAIGLLQLKHLDKAMAERHRIAHYYNERLASIPGITVIPSNRSQESNHSYYPMFVEDNYPLTRDRLYEKLKAMNIFSRRYFYPLISNLQKFTSLPSSQADNLPHAQEAARKILCLPIYPDLTDVEMKRIVDAIATT